MSKVAVLDTNYNVLEPCHPAVARKLLKTGKAAVLKCDPFTIILKREVDNIILKRAVDNTTTTEKEIHNDRKND